MTGITGKVRAFNDALKETYTEDGLPATLTGIVLFLGTLITERLFFDIR